jgi:gluconate 2-dehydrogenase alpha chain
MKEAVSIECKFVSLNPREARTVAIVYERMFPADENGPGATEIDVVNYVDKALAGPYGEKLEWYRLGLSALERVASQRYGTDFANCAASDQDELLGDLEKGQVPEFVTPESVTFFDLLRTHLQEGLFADPVYGGNRNKLGWKILNHPGVWLENSSEENITSEPVTKGGKIQSLADLDFSTGRPNRDHACKGYDPQRSVLPPSEIADIVLVGLGAMGGMVAPVFAKAGLKVVAIESGPWRTNSDYLPDELGATYYCRANMGSKFMREIPRWRRNADEPTQEATFSLGRMMNSVGGSVIHYGAWLRRFHPHHFKSRT